MTTAQEIVFGLACGTPRCQCARAVARGSGLTHCPAQASDTRPSLNVTQDGDKVLVRCHAGCEQDAVIAALEEKGLWGTERRTVKLGQLVHVYDYTDSQGNLMYQKLRYEPKAFGYRRPSGPDWIENLQGVTRVLYRLPEVQTAVAKHGRVYLTEGEKDADTLHGLGLVATTTGGVNDWTDAFVVHLVGAEIVICVDADDAGRKHAREKANSLTLAASSVKVLEFPGAKDVSEWFAHGGTKHELEEMVAAAPRWEGDGRKLLTAQDMALEYQDVLDHRAAKDPDYIGIPTGIAPLDRFIAYRPGDLILIGGSTGVGKTAMLQTLGTHLEDQRVISLFVSIEQSWVQLMDRYVAMAARVDGWKIAKGELTDEEWQRVSGALNRFYERQGLMVDDGAMQTTALEMLVKVAKLRGAKVIFVDYVQRLTDQKGDSEYQRINFISSQLARIARETNTCVVAASQVNRKAASIDGEPPYAQDLRQSGEEDAAVILTIGRKQGDSETKIRIAKNRHGLSGKLVALRYNAELTRFEPLSVQIEGKTPWVTD